MPEVVETGRLRMRRPRAADAAAIFARYASDAEVTRYMSWARHRTVADSEDFLAFSDSEWAPWGMGPYLIESREDSRLLGSTGLSALDGQRAITGYILARDAWGQGYATEALRAMVEVGRAAGLASLHASCHADHRASAHVLEKCGFVPDAAGTKTMLFPNLSDQPQPALGFVLRLQ